MRIVRPLVRKATKTVVYPLAPIVPVAKSLTVGTRRGNLNRKELRKQTELLERQTALLAQQAHAAQSSAVPDRMVTPDGRWVSYDGGNTYQSTGVPAAPPSDAWYLHPSQQTITPGARAVILCLTCKGRFDVDAGETAYTCPSCGAQNHLRLCPGCAAVIHIPAALAKAGRWRAIKCSKCRTKKPWPKWDQRPVTAAQYAARFTGATPDRRLARASSVEVSAPARTNLGIAEELGKLSRLRDDGVLTNAEFDAAKARLLE